VKFGFARLAVPEKTNDFVFSTAAPSPPALTPPLAALGGSAE